MTYRYWARGSIASTVCQTCRLFLRVCLRGNSDANRRDSCHHRLCFLPCLIPLSYVGLEEDSISSSLKETTKGEPCSEDRLQHNRYACSGLHPSPFRVLLVDLGIRDNIRWLPSNTPTGAVGVAKYAYASPKHPQPNPTAFQASEETYFSASLSASARACDYFGNHLLCGCEQRHVKNQQYDKNRNKLNFHS